MRLALLEDGRKGVGLGPDGLPDIDWVAIKGGEVTIEILHNPGDPNSEVVERVPRRVDPFSIARYPVTIGQFQAFVVACHKEDGEWLLPGGLAFNLPADYPPPKHRAGHANHPADTISWYDALAFCHWLSDRRGELVRLPTEFEWQRAATGGDPNNIFPWGRDWDPQQEPWRANTNEGDLGHSTAVDMYPEGLRQTAFWTWREPSGSGV